MDKILSEVYAVIIAMGEEYINRIPADVWNDIVEKKNNNCIPFVDENKALSEQSLAEDTITFIAMLYRDYWCNSEEEKESLLNIFAQNEVEWQAKIASTNNVRDLLKMVHRN